MYVIISYSMVRGTSFQHMNRTVGTEKSADHVCWVNFPIPNSTQVTEACMALTCLSMGGRILGEDGAYHDLWLLGVDATNSPSRMLYGSGSSQYCEQCGKKPMNESAWL